MMTPSTWKRAAALVCLLALAPPAHAYLDPSTGSMILSAIVGIFATAMLAVKTYWYKLKSLLRRERREASDREDGSPEQDASPNP